VKSNDRIRIALYTQQSFVAQGLAAVFRTHADLELIECRDSLSGTLDCRQGQIVSLVAQGLKNKEIAFSMGITEGTVKVYLYKLFQTLGMNDRLDMALYGRKNLFSGQLGLERGRDAASAADLPSLYLMARKQPVVAVAQ
jgi:DNA-binding CsgD family transcriptional regulator